MRCQEPPTRSLPTPTPRAVARRAPAQVTLVTRRRIPTLADPDLAFEVFMLLRGHPRTLAAVVMPDHLHWLVSDGSDLSTLVEWFKASSEGYSEPGRRLWQRSFFEASIGDREALGASAACLLENPVVGGLAARWQDYPWAYLAPSLGG